MMIGWILLAAGALTATWFGFVLHFGIGALPVNFWRARTRLIWQNALLRARILRIERRIEKGYETRNLRGEVAAKQRRLAELAFKHPHAFTGVTKEPDPKPEDMYDD